MESAELKRFRLRIVCIACAALAVCVAACMTALGYVAIEVNMDGYRTRLESASNAPFEGVSVDALDAGETDGPAYATYPSQTVWRVSVDAEGRALEAVPPQVGDQSTWTLEGDGFTSEDLEALADLRDERGEAPFEYGGCTWLGMWQPADGSSGGVVVSADGTVRDAGGGARSDAERVYTFIDMSYHADYARRIATRGVAATVLLSALAAAVLWVAAGRLLRPVSEAAERERAFVLAASHELKTPLMALMANCDVLDAEAGADGRLAPWIANIRAAADEMASKVAGLLGAVREGAPRDGV